MRSMKQYKYKALSKNLTEAESVMDISKVDTDILVSQIKAMQSGSDQAKIDFVNHLKKRYGIKDKNSMSSVMKALCVGVTGLTIVGNIIGIIAGAYSASQAFGWGLIGLGWLNIGCMVFSALLIFAFYKIFKVLINTEVSESVRPSKFNRQYKNLAIKKICLESNMMFKKISMISESYNLSEDAIDKASGIIAKAWVACKDMFSKIASGIAGFVKKHPAFTSAILICIGIIVAYKTGNKYGFESGLTNKQDTADQRMTDYVKGMGKNVPAGTRLFDPVDTSASGIDGLPTNS